MIAHTDAIPELEEIDPELCYTCWDIILTTGRGIDAIRDIFIFVENEAEISVDVIDDSESPLDFTDYKKLGEILVEKKEITPEELQSALKEKKFLGEVLIDRGLDTAIIDPCSDGLVARILAAEALSGKDEFCQKYLQAYRSGLLQ